MSNPTSVPLDTVKVPPELANTIKVMFELEESPTTLDDWVIATSDLLDDSAFSLGLEDMCTTEESRHVAQIGGETQHFHCVLDTLLLPFLLPEESPVAVRSRSPISDEVVELRVSRETIDATPPDAVMSFGVAYGLEVPDPNDIEPELAYQSICPYINAFASRTEYDQWASATHEASTMVLSFQEGLELARALAKPL